MIHQHSCAVTERVNPQNPNKPSGRPSGFGPRQPYQDIDHPPNEATRPVVTGGERKHREQTSLTGRKAPDTLSFHFRPCSEGAIQQRSALRPSKYKKKSRKRGAIDFLTISFDFNGGMNGGGRFIHVYRSIQGCVFDQQTRIRYTSKR